MTNCPNCSKNVEKKWNFCPSCGVQIPRSKMKSLFSTGMEDVFDKMFNEIHEQMFQSFMKPQKYEVKEKFNVPNMKGFSIKISSDQAGTPQINVQELGGSSKNYKHLVPHQHKKRTIPKMTLEPETKSNKLPGKQFVDIQLPGVKSWDDIDIIEGEESIEVRAYKGDTMYFKILQIDKDQVLQIKDFKNNVLHLEIGRE